jgi:hypothetical protein
MARLQHLAFATRRLLPWSDEMVAVATHVMIALQSLQRSRSLLTFTTCTLIARYGEEDAGTRHCAFADRSFPEEGCGGVGRVNAAFQQALYRRQVATSSGVPDFSVIGSAPTTHLLATPD